MHEDVRRILLDQNVPQSLTGWLREKLPTWEIFHVNELGFQGKPDELLYLWAQKHQTIIVTYDEDFADARLYPLGNHYGVIRLRVWPTTIEQTQEGINRLINALPPEEWHSCLIIIDNQKIRVRRNHNPLQSF